MKKILSERAAKRCEGVGYIYNIVLSIEFNNVKPVYCYASECYSTLLGLNKKLQSSESQHKVLSQ